MAKKGAPPAVVAPAPSAAAKYDDNWRQPLDSVDVNQGPWQCSAGMAVEFNVTHSYYLDAFNEAASTGIRRAIRIISAASLTNQIKQYATDLKLGREIVGLSRHTRNYPRACEEAFPICVKGGPNALPLELLAKLIKFEFLRLKNEHILMQQREHGLKQIVNQEFDAMIAGPKTCPVTQAAPPSGKGSVKTQAALAPLPKGNQEETASSIRLTKRGDDWKEHHFIDDSPKGGANLYVILSGFYNAELLVYLVQNRIPLVALVQMRRDGEELDRKIETETTAGKSISSKSKSSGHGGGGGGGGISEKDGNAMRQRTNDIVDFWTGYAFLSQHPKYSKSFENIAFITYKTPIIKMDAQHPENRTENKNLMFEHLSYAMYDVQDICRQHVNYIRHVHLTNITERNPAVQLKEMTVYNGLMDLIPLECVTIPILVNSLLEEVNVYVGLGSKAAEAIIVAGEPKNPVMAVQQKKEPKRCGGYKSKFVRMFERIERRYKCNLQQQKIPCEASTVHCKPRVIQYGNDIALMSFHLERPHINLEIITVEVLGQHVIPRLWHHLPVQSDEQNILYTGHLTKLFRENCPPNISIEVMWYVLHAKLFERMTCTSPMGKCLTVPMSSKMNRLSTLAVAGDMHRLRRSSIGKNFNLRSATSDSGLSVLSDSVCLDDMTRNGDLTKLFAKIMEEEEEENACCVDNKLNKLTFSIDDYNSIEQLDPAVMLQTVYKASNMFTCVDYHYFPLTDTLMLHFHNSHPENGIIHDRWAVHLSTPVCLRDFVNYVLDEEREWIEQEERVYEWKCLAENEEQKRRTILAKANEALLHSTSQHPAVELRQGVGEITYEDYLLPGSIKQRLHMEQQQEQVHQPTRASTASSTIRASLKELPKTTAKSVNEDLALEHELFPPFPNTSIYRKNELRTDQENICFIGYDLGPARVQKSGKTSHLYSNDGTNIKIDSSEWNLGNKLLSIEICKGKHSLYLHSMATSPPTGEDPFTFHFYTSNGIILAFTKTPTVACHKIRNLFENVIVKFITKSGVRIVEKSGEKANISSKSKSSVSYTSAPKQETKTSERVYMEPTVDVETKMTTRSQMEKQLHEYLMSDEVLDPDNARKSKFTRTKAQILSQLANAKQNSYPCYRIYSSKLHLYKYIKRIKPQVTVSIGGIIRRISIKSKPLAKPNVDDSKLHYKWTRTSQAIVEQRVPMDFEFRATWPTGLSIQTIPTSYIYDPFYVKQMYLAKGPACQGIADELSRCFLRNGTVLIFCTGGKLKILCPDSSIFECCVDGFKPISLKPNIAKIRFQHKLARKIDHCTMCYEKQFRPVMKTRRIIKHIIDGQTGLRMPLSRRLYLRRQKKTYKIAERLFREEPRLIPIPEYGAVRADGSKCTVRNERICDFPSQLIVQVGADYTNGEVYMEREDGTSSLLTANGTLTTCFPDGTHISTSYVIESDELFVAFTDEEYQDLIQRLFKVGDRTADDVGERAEEEIELHFEGFVSVLLNVTFKHRNYASVSYFGLDMSATIGMPSEIEVFVSRHGTYAMDLDRATYANINESHIVFRSTTCIDCRSVSHAVVDLSPFTLQTDTIPEFYVINTDSLGETTYVDYQGHVQYAQDTENADDRSFIHKCLSYVERGELVPKQRYFLIERDLSGSEFIHDDERSAYLQMIQQKKHSTMTGVQESKSTHEGDNYTTVMHGMHRNYSESWSTDFSVEKVIPTYIRRKDMLPSTYFPGVWLSAFPRHRISHDKGMTMNNPNDTWEVPKVLVQRIFLDISMGRQFHRRRYIPLLTPLSLEEQVDGARCPVVHLKTDESSSAMDFKTRWYKRVEEVAYYQDVLRRQEIPPYFSQDMEDVMFGTPNFYLSNKQKVLLGAMQRNAAKKARTADTPTKPQLKKFKTNKGPYEPDLIKIAGEWVKRGYQRYQCTGTKHKRSSGVSIAVQTVDDDDKDSDSRHGQKKTLTGYDTVPSPELITLHMSPTQRHKRNCHCDADIKLQRAKVPLDDVISPRCKEKVDADGSRPYVQPMKFISSDVDL